MAEARVESLSRLLRAAAPTLIGLAGVILLASPIRLFDGLAPTPLIPFVVVYFWSIYSPGYLPAASVFGIGLLQDLVSGGSLGLWPTVYLVTQYLVLSQRSYFHGRDQKVVWLGFFVVALMSAAMIWGVMSLMAGFTLPVGGLMVQMLATVATYPVFAAVFREFHRRVIVEL